MGVEKKVTVNIFILKGSVVVTHMKKVALIFLVMLSLAFICPSLILAGSEIEYQGLFVPEGETRRYADQTITVHGGLSVEGTLILDNVTLVLNTTGNNRFAVEDGGTIRMSDSTLISQQSQTTSEITYSLQEGMNMLSFPFHRADDHILEVLSALDGHYDRVYYYDTSYARPWKTYFVGRTERFNNLHNIIQTMGVEINVTESLDLTTTGFLMDTYRYNLNEGWNWISYPLAEPMKVEDFFSCIIDNVTALRTTEVGSGSDLDLDDLMFPGFGYKVYVDNSVEMLFENPNGLSEHEFSQLRPEQGVGLIFEKGSSGVLSRSTIRGSGTADGVPDIIIRSSSVGIHGCTFIDNIVALRIEGTSTAITNSEFEHFTSAGIQTINSHVTVEGCVFYSYGGVGIQADNSELDIDGVEFYGHSGLRISSSRGFMFNSHLSALSGGGIDMVSSDFVFFQNTFQDITGIAIRSQDGTLQAEDNVFHRCGGSINAENSLCVVDGNQFQDNGYGVFFKGSSVGSMIRGNWFRESQGWSLRGTDAHYLEVINNDIEDSSYGIHLSGNNITVTGNLISGCYGRGLFVDEHEGLHVSNNVIRDNGGVGIELNGLTGNVLDNRILSNSGGVSISSGVYFYNNTVSNNRFYGIFVRDASHPLFENVTLSGNANHGIRFEDSTAFVKTTSIMGSRYHLHLSSSTVNVLMSLFDESAVWVSDDSELIVNDTLTIHMNEDEPLRDYDILSYLPPGTTVRGVRDNGTISITVDREGRLNIIPPQNYHGTVNFTLDVNIFGTERTSIPVRLVIQQVNDPPIIEEVYLNITYGPTRVRWVLLYTDHDDMPPRYVELVVEGDHYTMKEVDPSDTDFASGKLYYYEMFLEPGEYRYHYIAEETNLLGPNITVRTPTETFVVESQKASFTPGLTTIGLSFITILFISILLYLVFVRHLRKVPWGSDVIDPSDIEDPDCFDPLVSDIDSKYVNVCSLPLLKLKNEVINRNDLPVLKKRHGGSEDDDGPDEKDQIETLSGSDIRDTTLDKEGTYEDHEIDFVGEIVDEEPEELSITEDGLRKQRILKTEGRKVTMAKHRVIKSDHTHFDKSRKMRRLKGQDN